MSVRHLSLSRSEAVMEIREVEGVGKDHLKVGHGSIFGETEVQSEVDCRCMVSQYPLPQSQLPAEGKMQFMARNTVSDRRSLTST